MSQCCPYCRKKNFITQLRDDKYCLYCGYIDDYLEWEFWKGFRRLFWEKGFNR